MFGSHERPSRATARRYGSQPHPLSSAEREAIRRLMALLGMSARSLADAIGRSHTLLNDALAGRAELTADDHHRLDAALSAAAREAVSTASTCVDPGAVFLGVRSRVLTRLEAATAEALLALESPDESSAAASLGVSDRALRSWLSGAVPANASALEARVTPETCHRVHPWLGAPSRAPIGLGSIAQLLDEAFESDERGAIDATLLDAKLRLLLERRSPSPPEPSVLAMHLDGLTLDASCAAEPRTAWRALLPEQSLPLGPFVGVTGRWDLRIERSGRDHFALDDERRHYEFTWCVCDALSLDAQVLATLSYKPKRGRQNLLPLRLVVHGGAFAAGIAEQLREALLAPVVVPGTVRVAGAHVALDVGCEYARLLEHYGGRGRVARAFARSGAPFDTTYRCLGSGVAQLVTYDRLAEEHDALHEENWPRVRRPRARHAGGPGARIELRLHGGFGERGLTNAAGFVDGLPDELCGRFAMIDLTAAIADASPLEALALRMIAALGHDRLGPPRPKRRRRRRIAPGHVTPQAKARRPPRARKRRATKDAREPSRNELTERASQRLVSVLRGAGLSTKRARAIATRWHHAATFRLEQLARAAPLFADLAAVLRDHAGNLRIQLSRLVDGTPPDVDELLRPENRAAFDGYMRDLERVADPALLEESVRLAQPNAVVPVKLSRSKRRKRSPRRPSRR